VNGGAADGVYPPAAEVAPMLQAVFFIVRKLLRVLRMRRDQRRRGYWAPSSGCGTPPGRPAGGWTTSPTWSTAGWASRRARP